jgi:hypothetical protein
MTRINHAVRCHILVSVMGGLSSMHRFANILPISYSI